MSGSGTDKTKSGLDLAGPVVILVEQQLGENIGMAARAMGNFALSRLRIVNPRDGWPNVAAQRAAAGADTILESAELFDTVEQAVADLTLLFATTARAHDQAKPVVAPAAAAGEIVAHVAGGGGAGILFGRERYGLQNEEVALANRIITFPVNPGFASLNLAQAVLLIGYEWFKLSTGGTLPFAMPERILWQALTSDRRFAGQFKRQTPVGRHIPDFVSFVHRIAIELVNPAESEAIVADRAARQAWLEARDYRVIEMRVTDVERDLAAELVRLEGMLRQVS